MSIREGFEDKIGVLPLPKSKMTIQELALFTLSYAGTADIEYQISVEKCNQERRVGKSEEVDHYDIKRIIEYLEDLVIRDSKKGE